MSESYITVRDGKVTGYAGPDATLAYQAITIAYALKFYAKTRTKVNRAYTPTNMIRAASAITGKSYKLGEYERAAADLLVWANEMKAALPVVED